MQWFFSVTLVLPMVVMSTSCLILIFALLLTSATTANSTDGIDHTSYLKAPPSLWGVPQISYNHQMAPSHLDFTTSPPLPSPYPSYPSGSQIRLTTVAWSANRNRPVYRSRSKVKLKKDGGLVLTDVDGMVVWQTNTSFKEADHAELMNSGNLVVKDQGGNILWQSFDHPTDTLLPTQPVTATGKLVSTDLKHPSSYYSLHFDDRYILSLAYDGPEISTVYWPNPDLSSWMNYRISYNSSRRGVLDKLGQFIASDNTGFFQQTGARKLKGD
jgi:hypothetical protein